MAVYDDLIARLTLLPHHREALRTTRGFTDDMIDTYQLRSCGPHAAAAVAELRSLHDDARLKETKILVDVNGVLKINRQLTEDHILIPYTNRDGVVEKVRPHKLGFKDDPVAVFRTRKSFDPGHVCVIAESEFKAIAAEALGYPAIGIPGISAMGGEHFDKLIDALKNMSFSEYVICFDNEVKDNPEFSNYKARWKDRYDTIIWAYTMASKIYSAGFLARVATLPAEWMVDGKIDIDGALAQGKSPTQFAAVISGAQSPKIYIKKVQIPEKHWWYFHKRIKTKLFTTPIFIQDRCYWMNTSKGPVKLTNFTMRIKHTFTDAIYNPHEPSRERLLVVTDCYGIESRPAFIAPGATSSRISLQRWLQGQGEYLMYGKDDTVSFLWDYVYNADESDVIYRVREMGYVPALDMWIFKNAVYHKGVEYLPDEDGIFHVGDSCYAVGQTALNDVEAPVLPMTGEFNLQEFLRLFYATIDLVNPGMGAAMFGWVLANMFSYHIIQQYKIFPLLFFYGNKTGGKTTVMRWLHSFLGTGKMNYNLKASSQVGVTRALQRYHHVPIVADDWRNTLEFKHYITYFLGVYERQQGLKGTLRPGEIVATTVNGNLAILGEEMIMDGGVLSRCLMFYMPQQELRKENYINEIDRLVAAAGKYTRDILINYDTYVGQVMNNIKWARDDLEKLVGVNANSRALLNYSIIIGAYRTFLGDNQDMINYIVAQFKDQVTGSAAMELDRVKTFTEELLSVDIAGQLPTTCFNVVNNFLMICMRPACDAVARYYRRDGDNAPLLTRLLMSQAYFVKAASVDIGGRTVPAMVLDIQKMPEDLAANVRGLGRGFPGVL